MANKFCPECGKQLPDNVKFCPYCGHSNQTSSEPVSVESENAKVKNKKPAWLIVLAVIGAIVGICAIISGILDFKKAADLKPDNCLVNNYYVGSVNNSIFVWRFDNDGVFQSVEPNLKNPESSLHEYGIYAVNESESAMTIEVDGVSYDMVIVNNGDAIKMGKSIEMYKTDPSELKEETLAKFDN